MRTKEYTIKGIRPLLLHNGRTADPLDPYSKKKKEISGKRKKTEEDYIALGEIEWEAGIYWSDELGLYVPTDNIESMLVAGAKKRRLGTQAKAGVFIAAEYGVPIQTPPGMPSNRELEKLRAHPSFRFRRACGIQQSKVMVTRPMIPTGWQLTFEIEFDDELLNESSVDEMLADAGRQVGIGTYRPKFGRFIIV